MAILWAGGEDIDFPNGGSIFVAAGDINRSGYARCGIASGSFSTIAKSTTFQGGAVTSAWMTFQLHSHFGGNSTLCVGFGLSGTNKGLFVGSDASGFIALFTYDGTTAVKLASSSPTTTLGSQRIDMQVSNYGASATVNIYAASVLVLTFTGNVAVSGMSNFDSVFIHQNMAGNSFYAAEIVVSSTDSRNILGLVTLALNGAGATDSWTGTYSNINGTAFSDANPVFTNTATQDEQFTVNGLPSGSFSVAAVKTTVRAAASAGATAGKVNLGYGNGTTQGFGGAAQTAPAAYGTLERYDTVNPITSTSFVQSDISTLQIDLRSSS